MKYPEILSEFLEFYPRKILERWLLEGQKRTKIKRPRKAKGVFTKREAQEKLREIPEGDLEALIEGFKKK